MPPTRSELDDQAATQLRLFTQIIARDPDKALVCAAIITILEAYTRLKVAAVVHRTQRADDRCIGDDDMLYEAIGDGIKCDRRVGCQIAMIENCIRFVKNRTEEGGPWVSYAELEAERDRLKEEIRLLKGLPADPNTPILVTVGRAVGKSVSARQSTADE